MNVQCPHCGASFSVSEERAQNPDAGVTCPECLTSFAMKDADAGDSFGELDLDFDLDALSSAGISGIDISRHGLDALSAVGFDDSVSQEVSHLSDVDLGLAGTYHRTGRKLHHATDVVWTERRQGPAPTATSAPPASAPPPIPSESVAPRQTAPAAHASAPTMSGFPPLDEGTDGAVDLPNLQSGPSSGPPSLSAESATALSDLGDVAGEEATAMLEEMDFSSLLEDSLSGSKSLFGQDSNPFLDVGITGDSVTAHVEVSAVAGEKFQPDDDTSTFFIEAPSVASQELSSPASPSPDVAMSDPGGFDVSGTFDLDVGGDGPLISPANAAPAKARAAAPKRATSGAQQRSGRKTSGGSSKGLVAVIGVLALVAGLGVAAEALGYGWFFMNLLDGDASQNARPGEPANAAANQQPIDPVVAPTPTRRPGMADTPAAYDQKIGAVEAELSEKPEDAAAQAELVVLELRYRYRWPGRFYRDAARTAKVTELLAKGVGMSVEARFWELLTETPKPGKQRADLLQQAEVVVSQVDPTTLPPGRDFLYKAILFREQKKLENARGLLDLAVRAAPEDQWALFEQARLQLQQEQLDEADATLDTLLRINPKHADASLLAARVAWSRQTPDAYARARQLSEQVLLDAQAAGDKYGEYEANLARAVVYGLQNDLGKRLEALEGASKYDAKDETLLLELAENDLKGGQAEKAAKRLKACGDGVCTSARYYRTHIKVLYVSHQLPEAEALVQKAEKRYPDDVELTFWAARVIEARGKLSIAARKYMDVKEKDPKYLEAYLRLAGIYRRQKQFDAAIAVLNEASQVFEAAGKDSSAALALLQERGELLMRQGRTEQAREVFAKIVAAQPNNAPARVRLATLLTDLGYPQKAVPHFEKLYEQGKSDPEVNIKFAEALILSGKPERAIEELNAFLDHNPKSLEGLVKLGHAYVQKQRYEDAMAVLEHAVAINQNYAPAYYFAGLAELGRQRQKAEDVERKRRNGEVIRDEERPDFTKAIIALTTAKDKAPEQLGYKKSLAEALTESGQQRNLLAALEQYDDIVKAYQHATRLGRPVNRSPDVYYRRGLLASKLGRPRPEILQNFQEALVLDGERADFIGRYAEELYKQQAKVKIGNRYVLEAKSYFELVLKQHNANHVRANYYMGLILLREWDHQRHKKPGDALHAEAQRHFSAVIAHGIDEFPEAHLQMGNILRDQNMYRVSNEHYRKYLDTYRRIHHRDPANARYVRDLIRQKG